METSTESTASVSAGPEIGGGGLRAGAGGPVNAIGLVVVGENRDFVAGATGQQVDDEPERRAGNLPQYETEKEGRRAW